MACSITITSVIYDPVTSTVHVTGTQAGVCPPVPSGVVEIVVKVLCAPGNTQQGIATPDAQGNWAVDISLICTCGGWVYVTASCATDATCSGSYQSGALQCEGNCPTGSIDWDIDDCNPDGTRNVRLKVNITSAPPTPTSIGQFDYGTGSFSQFVAFNAAGTYSDPLPPPGYPYVPGTPYTVRFIFAQIARPLLACFRAFSHANPLARTSTFKLRLRSPAIAPRITHGWSPSLHWSRAQRRKITNGISPAAIPHQKLGWDRRPRRLSSIRPPPRALPPHPAR